MTKKLIILIIGILVCIAPKAFAVWNIPITDYRPSVYKIGMQNWQIKQHNNGWLYIANSYGLLEYDGVNFNIYGVWNSSSVRSIEIADNGDIYVGANSEFGFLRANEIGELTYTPLSLSVPDEYKDFSDIWNIHIIDDRVYMHSKKYIFEYQNNIYKQTYTIKSKSAVSAKISDSILIAAVDGIYLLRDNKIDKILDDSTLLDVDDVCSIVKYRENMALIATMSSGLYLYDGVHVTKFETEADEFIKENRLFSLTLNENYIAYGTVLDGCAITDIQGANVQYINQKSGLLNNTVLSLFFDDMGNLWLGLDQGFCKVHLNSATTNLYNTTEFKGAGYCSAIFEGQLYVGTNQGLYTKPLNSYASALNSIDDLSGQVWALDVIDNKLYCSHSSGLYQISRDGIKTIVDTDGFWGIRGMSIRNNYAVAGGYNGLYILERTVQGYALRNKVKGVDDDVRLFEVDSNDRIWVVTPNGIEAITLSLNMSSCSIEHVERAVSGDDYFAVAKFHDKIIVSNNRRCKVTDGNNHLVKDSLFFANYLGGEKLYNNITSDEYGNLWFIAQNNIYLRRFNSENQTYDDAILYHLSDPLVDGFSHITPYKGDVIVANVSGFSLLNMNVVHRNKQLNYNRALNIRSIQVTTPKDSTIYGESYVENNNSIKLKHENNSILVTVGGVIAQHTDANEYRYKLSPIEKEFCAWSTNNIKEYTNLHEGEYTLYVEMQSGVSTHYQVSKDFIVLPPWYRSWWGNILWLAVIMSTAMVTVKVIRTRIKHNELMLKYNQQEELNHQKELHSQDLLNKEREILQLKSEQMESELKSKSKELSNVILNSVTRNELIESVRIDLRKIQKSIQEGSDDNAMRRIILLNSRLSQSVEQEAHWDKFEENFDIVHNNLLANLDKHYPWMSHNERKLCVYAHMGLVTKEIAPLMNITTRGVEMLRYRMRKKMELERSETIESAIRRCIIK